MYHREIIDSHMHLWDLKNNYDWLNRPVPEFEQLIGDYESLRHNFLPNDYKALVQHQNIVKSVHIQAFGFPDDPVAETKWLQMQSDKYGFPHGIVAFANLMDPEVGKVLEQHAQFANVRGIRMPLNYDKVPYRRMADRGDYLSDKQWQKGFARLADYNFSFDLQIYDHQLEDVIQLAQHFPHIKMIIEHFAWPIDLSLGGFVQWKQRMSDLTKYPNVFMKLSGLGCVFRRFPLPQVCSYLHEAIKILGIDRCMFGSNCPPDTLFYEFDALMNIYKDVLSNYSAEDQYKFFYSNAKDFYRL